SFHFELYPSNVWNAAFDPKHQTRPFPNNKTREQDGLLTDSEVAKRRTSELTGRGDYIQSSHLSIKLRKSLSALRSNELLCLKRVVRAMDHVYQEAWERLQPN